jgi:prolyl 4-hydroxylase
MLLLLLLLRLLLLTGASISARRGSTEAFAYATPDRRCQKKLFFEVHGFLTPAECDALVREAKSRGMEHSEVDEEDSIQPNVRNSTQAWLGADVNSAARKMRRKTVELVRRLGGSSCFGGARKLRESRDYEDIQVVRYRKEGKYEPHHDCLLCGKDLGVECQRGQRVATLLVYLNDGFGGGRTRFPDLDVAVRPVKGKALFFWVSDPRSALVFRDTLHGSDPVESGEKWIATQWIRAPP